MMDPAEAARMVEYLAGHAVDDEGQNPWGQELVIDTLEEMDRKDLEAVAWQALWSLGNEHNTCVIPDAAAEAERGRLRAALDAIAATPPGGTTLLSPPTVADLQAVARNALAQVDAGGEVAGVGVRYGNDEQGSCAHCIYDHPGGTPCPQPMRPAPSQQLDGTGGVGRLDEADSNLWRCGCGERYNLGYPICPTCGVARQLDGTGDIGRSDTEGET